MLLFAKQRVVETGIPDHVVRMYLEQSTDGLAGRMHYIISIAIALRSPQPATQPAASAGLDETPALIAKQTKFQKGIVRIVLCLSSLAFFFRVVNIHHHSTPLP